MIAEYIYGKLGIFPEILLGPILIYILVVLCTRIFGLKSFSQMTGFDFAMTIAMGSLIASSIINDVPSLAVGAILITALFALNALISFLRYKSKTFMGILDNKPILLMWEGDLLKENMSKARVSEGEIRAKLREANVLHRDQVQAVILETTGDVSVLHSVDDTKIEEYILEGVER